MMSEEEKVLWSMSSPYTLKDMVAIHQGSGHSSPVQEWSQVAAPPVCVCVCVCKTLTGVSRQRELPPSSYRMTPCRAYLNAHFDCALDSQGS
jgi:hypothetical protein